MPQSELHLLWLAGVGRLRFNGHLATHFAELAEYLSQNLELDQVQLDDLYVRLGVARSKQGDRVCWLYNAFDPVR